MNLSKLMALLALTAGGMASIACGNSIEGTGGSAGSSGGDGGPACANGTHVSYDTCAGSFAESCPDGACAQTSLEQRVYAEWKAQVKALAGYSDADFAARMKIQTISTGSGGAAGSVSIEYMVVLDWVKARMQDMVPLLTAQPSDAEVTQQVAASLSPRSTAWMKLGAVKQAPTTMAVEAAFDGCFCGLKVEYCSMRFLNVTGELIAKGIGVIDEAANRCKAATVEVTTAKVVACGEVPCAIN
jgi:hypothetical protein